MRTAGVLTCLLAFALGGTAARAQSQAGTSTAQEGQAQTEGQAGSSKPPADQGQPQLPPAGVQGAPNPLQDDKKYLTGQDLLDETFPNSIPIPGTQVRFAIGGYAKLDVIRDLDHVGDRYEFELSTIPVSTSPLAAYGGRASAQAKESRINFDFRSKAHNAKKNKDFPLQAFLEIDFFEDNPALARQPRTATASPRSAGRIASART